MASLSRFTAKPALVKDRIIQYRVTQDEWDALDELRKQIGAMSVHDAARIVAVKLAEEHSKPSLLA